jgi:hypothetical protein
MPGDRRDRRREIDREFAVVLLTWEDQQRRRRQLLRRMRDIASRFSTEDALSAPRQRSERRAS